MSDPTKTKKPKRSDNAIAADYARRSEAARLRSVRKSPQWIRLTAAIEALGSLAANEGGDYVDHVQTALTEKRADLENDSAKAEPAK